MGRPIRVVLFGGAFFEPAALEFMAQLDEHPEVTFLGAVCQSRGFGLRHVVGDVVRRRRLLAPAVLSTYAVQAAQRFLRAPRTALARRHRSRGVLRRALTVPDIHAAAVLQHVGALQADLGLVYGSPILKPQLFDTPALGTLGIHHGTLPAYRGKKTAFWAMLNGEASTGVAIQRLDAGVDTGDLLLQGAVSIGGKRYGHVEAEVQALGVELFVAAVIAVKRGTASLRPQPPGRTPLFGQPRPRHILQLWYRQLTRRWPRRGGEPAGSAARARPGA